MGSKSYILLIMSIISIFQKNLLLYGHALGMAASFPTEIVSIRHSISTKNCSRYLFRPFQKDVSVVNPEIGTSYLG